MICNAIVTLMITMNIGVVNYEQTVINKKDLPEIKVKLGTNITKKLMELKGVKSIEFIKIEDKPEFDCATGKDL